MPNYTSIDPITGLQNGQAVAPISFSGKSSKFGKASVGTASSANTGNELSYGTSIVSLDPVVETVSLGVTSSTSEMDFASYAMPAAMRSSTGKSDPSISRHGGLGGGHPPAGGGGWW